MTRDGTAEHVSRDQILRRERGQGKMHFPCSADHEQDWQPYPVDPYPCNVLSICDYHTYIRTYIDTRFSLRVDNEQDDAGRDGQTCSARAISLARTGTEKYT